MNCPHCGHAIKPKLGLTARQTELLRYIREYREAHDISPSFGEMMVALNLHSKNSIHLLVVALEERGHISRKPARTRSIQLVEQAHA